MVIMNSTDRDFKQFVEKQEPSWYKEYRKKHLELLKSTKLPSFRYGLAIQIKPTLFNFESIKPKAELDNTKVSAEQNSGITILSSSQLSEKEELFKEFLSEDWIKEEDNHTLFHFHQAFANDFLLIHIDKNTSTEKPIQIDYDINDAPLLSNIFVLAESGSNAKILLNKTNNSTKEKSYFSDDIRVIAKNGSTVDIITIQSLDKSSALVQRKMSKAHKDSTVNWIDLNLGSEYLKSSIYSNLIEQGSSSKITTLFSGNENQRYDIYTASIHGAPNTSSDIVSKGVLNQKAKALSRGLVKIESNAAESSGYEQQDCMLLSKDAEADAIPNLEIDNNDVKCSHGSTVGQIDQEQVFYLRSRGLTEEQAKQKIIEGYFTPVLDMFEDQDMRGKIQQSIIESLYAGEQAK